MKRRSSKLAMARIVAALVTLRGRLMVAEQHLQDGDASGAIEELEQAERDFRATMQELRVA